METYCDGHSAYGRQQTRRTSNWRLYGRGKMDRLKEIVDQVWFVLPFGIWATLGYMCRVLQTGWPGWRLWFSQLVIVFLVGATCGMLLAETEMSEFVKYGICSCIGMSGGKIVEDLTKWARRRAEKVIAGDARSPNPDEED